MFTQPRRFVDAIGCSMAVWLASRLARLTDAIQNVGPPFRPECQYRDNGEYRYDARSPNWFGFKIAERLGADRKDPKQMKVVAAILDDLIEEGTLQIKEKKDEERKTRKFVVPGVLAGVENL
jgi:hypothetical protein